MSEQKRFKHFFIEFDSLGEEERALPFDLYIYQTINGQFTLDLSQNSVLTNVKREYLKRIISTGGKIAVTLNEMNPYLEFTNLKKEDVPSLDYTQHPLHQLLLKHQEEYKDYLEAHVNYLEILRGILRQEDFTEVIKRTKAELYQYPFTISPTVSLAHQLAIEYLNDSKVLNKTLALSFIFARLLGLEDKEELSNLVVACVFRDIGMTQISYEQFILQDPMTNLERGYQKHPALSLFLLNKSNLKLEAKTMKIIMDHHELFNGRGFPSGKKEQQLELLPQIIGLADHIVSFSEGLLTEKKTSYLKTFKAVARGTEMTGLQHGYHPSLIELLIKTVMVFD
jgi:response regulator RpfG family c-di-GMP phosphodiesterase